VVVVDAKRNRKTMKWIHRSTQLTFVFALRDFGVREHAETFFSNNLWTFCCALRTPRSEIDIMFV
jgi:hypothetical protein